MKNLRVRVFWPGNKRHYEKLFSAPRGHRWTPSGIDAQLELTASQIEKRWPMEHYHLVPVGHNAFNFVHLGHRLRYEEAPA
jgi:hypothetical protein